MSALDEVAALPGGAAVTELIREIDSADPQALREIFDGWQKAVTGCLDAGGALSRIGTDHEDALKGEFADSFRDYLSSATQASSTLSRALEEARTALTAATAALEGARNWTKARCEWLLSMAKAITTSQSVSGKEVQDNVIRTLCDETATEVRQVLSTYEVQLKIALEVMRRLTAEGKPFSALKMPESSQLVWSKVVTPGRQEQQWSAVAPPSQGTQFSRPAGIPTSTKTEPLPALVPQTPGSPIQRKMPGNVVTSADDPVNHGSSGGGSGGSGGSGSVPATMPSGQIGDWIRDALEALRASGINIDDIDPADLAAIIQHESSGDPHAVNGWDSNAAAGHPSKGLMQTIDSTFQAYKLPGHDDIWNPVDNIIAAVRYAIERYGSVKNVPGLSALSGGGGYVGY